MGHPAKKLCCDECLCVCTSLGIQYEKVCAVSVEGQGLQIDAVTSHNKQDESCRSSDMISSVQRDHHHGKTRGYESHQML